MRVAAILIPATLLLSGCLGLIEEDQALDAQNEPPGLADYQTDDPRLPAKGNDKLFLHRDAAGDQWMDTLAAGADEPVPVQILPTGPDQWFRFELRPAPSRALTFGADPAVLSLEVSGGTATGVTVVGTAPDVRARLLVGGQPVSEASTQGTLGGPITLNLDAPPMLKAGAPLAVEFCLCRSQVTLAGDYSVATGEHSWLDLPVETPEFVSGTAVAAQPVAAGEFQRVESDVETFRDDGRWIARQVVTLTNDFASGTPLELGLYTTAGGIDAADGGSDEYKIVVTLEGRGDTEAAALSRLEALSVRHTDDQDGGLRALETRVESDGQWDDQIGRIDARLPAPRVRDARLETTSGGIDMDGLSGDRLVAMTTSGGIGARDLGFSTLDAQTQSGGIDVIDGAFESLTVEAGSGGLTLDRLEVDTLRATTTSGGIDARLTPTRSGSYDLETTSGGVEVRLATGPEFGYDAEASASSGGTSIDLPDTEPVGEQTKDRKHERTTDYDERAIQTRVTASTTSGGADIESD